MIYVLSLLGVINSLILIIYGLITKKGIRTSNRLFSLLVLVLSLRVSKSIILTYSIEIHDIFLTMGLVGFIAIGPVYMLFVNSIINKKFSLKILDFVHVIPAILFLIVWTASNKLRVNEELWPVIYRSMMFYYIIYVLYTVNKLNTKPELSIEIRKKINVITVFILIIWFSYYLDTVSSLPYISGAIIYSLIIYFTLWLLVNKGYILSFNHLKKYEKTGLSENERKRILKGLQKLMEEEKVYKDCTISLSKLARSLHTSTHVLSQVINAEKHKSFYELLSSYRIKEAEELLVSDFPSKKITDIAFDVGYNSVSAFYSSFKKITGKTPKQFKESMGHDR